MRALTVTERFGMFALETSDGKKYTGATLVSVLHKATSNRNLPLDVEQLDDGYDPLVALFDAIKPSSDGGQIVHGRASG